MPFSAIPSLRYLAFYPRQILLFPVVFRGVQCGPLCCYDRRLAQMPTYVPRPDDSAIPRVRRELLAGAYVDVDVGSERRWAG